MRQRFESQPKISSLQEKPQDKYNKMKILNHFILLSALEIYHSLDSVFYNLKHQYKNAKILE